MAKQTIFNVAKRRKREGLTNYRKRLKLLKSGLPRLVIRPSLKGVSVQIIEFHPFGDKVLVSAHSSELKKIGWDFGQGNVPAAYLTGLLIGPKAKDKEVILDIGLKTPTKGSRVFACLKGAADSGLKVHFSEDIVPDEGRISGKHIVDFANKLKDNKELFDKQFSFYIKNNLDPLQIPKVFEDTKNKILKVK